MILGLTCELNGGAVPAQCVGGGAGVVTKVFRRHGSDDEGVEAAPALNQIVVITVQQQTLPVPPEHRAG